MFKELKSTNSPSKMIVHEKYSSNSFRDSLSRLSDSLSRPSYNSSIFNYFSRPSTTNKTEDPNIIQLNNLSTSVTNNV